MRPIERLGLAAAAFLVAFMCSPVAAQAPALDANASVSVVVTYADGRRSPMTVGPTSGGAWTSAFPRLPAWTPPPNQDPVGAIKYMCLRTPEGVRVTITVFRGSQRLQDEPVTAVVVTPARSVIVDSELRAIGIQPVTLSVAPIAVPDLHAPDVTVVSSQLEVANVTVVTTPIATYGVTLQNHSPKAVRSIEILATRGGRPALSMRRAGHEGDALVAPGDAFQFGVQVPTGRGESGGVVSLAPVDLIRITTVRWTDGTYDGDARTAAYDDVFDYATRIQLSRVVDELERAQKAGPMATPAAVRGALLGLSAQSTDEMVDGSRSFAGPLSRDQVAHEISTALAQLKKIVVDDLAEFESGRMAPGTFAGWLHTEHDRYQRWAERLAR